MSVTNSEGQSQWHCRLKYVNDKPYQSQYPTDSPWEASDIHDVKIRILRLGVRMNNVEMAKRWPQYATTPAQRRINRSAADGPRNEPAAAPPFAPGRGIPDDRRRSQ